VIWWINEWLKLGICLIESGKKMPPLYSLMITSEWNIPPFVLDVPRFSN
jgi:hypothetical protein